MSPHQVDPVALKGDAVAKAPKSVALHRDLRHTFPRVVRGEGSYLIQEDGERILDASGGASVACIGHGDKRVVDAAMKQMSQVAYCATVFFTNEPYERLSRFLIDSTDGKMARAYIVNSGSEAMETAIKMARQYFLEKADPEPQRTRFIARNRSYHGITLGALSVGGHAYRRDKFKPLMAQNTTHVSPCYPYREKSEGESDESYISRLAAELDSEFERVGANTVCAFVAEPVVGAALGCVDSLPGYFQAMEAVCRKHGALLILDEVMCGMGRSGTLHAWEQEGVVPDIQTMGKALSGGYQPAAAVLIGHRVNDALEKGSGVFVHGHTYQGHPVVCAAALEVQRIIREENLVENVQKMGELLSKGLRESIGGHRNVGDIRGRGLFWGIEFVADKSSREPFPPQDHVAMEIAALGVLKPYNISVYPGSGTVDGIRGDHVIVSPPYNVSVEEVGIIVDTIARLVGDYFAGKA